jgi:predicted transcriptional regulator
MKINFKTNPGQLAKAHGAREPRVTAVKHSYTRAGKPLRSNLSLPQEVVDTFKALKDREVRNDYIRALHNNGWTNASISRAVGLSTEMVSNIVKKEATTTAPLHSYFLVPEVPTYPNVAPKKEYTLPSDELLARLKELQPLAQLVRSSSPRYRGEAEEYAYLLNKAVTEQNVTVYRLAKLLGITPSAIAFRLVRYGYRTTENGKTKAYQTIKETNRSSSAK